jgi:hypothetical protein
MFLFLQYKQLANWPSLTEQPFNFQGGTQFFWKGIFFVAKFIEFFLLIWKMQTIIKMDFSTKDFVIILREITVFSCPKKQYTPTVDS